MAEEDEELLAMFVQEAVEHLENIEPDLLVLEEQGADTDPEIVNGLFRGVHSIKGSAGFFGLTAISKLSHVMENLLGKVRDKTFPPTSEISDSLLSGLDKLKTMVHDVVNSESIDASEEVRVIQAILDGNGTAANAPAAGEDAGETAAEAEAASGEAPETENAAEPAAEEEPPAVEESAAPEEEATEGEPETVEATETLEESPEPEAAPAAADPLELDRFPDAVADALRSGRHFYIVDLPLQQATNEEKKTFLDQFKQLVDSVGAVHATDPALNADNTLPPLTNDTIRLLLSTVLEMDLFQALIQMPPEGIRQIAISEEMKRSAALQVGSAAPAPVEEPVAAPEPEPETSPFEEEPIDLPEAGPGPRLRKPQNDGVPKPTDGKQPKKEGKASQPTVEETLRVSVAVLDELINMAGELVLTRNQLIRATAEITSQFPHLGPLVQSLDSITIRIQEKVMHARMQPVSVVFNKFPRIVRDLARKLDKKIDLDLQGGDVELDKSVIEHLSDPLTHMIRNVADHAIELPKDRVGKGKPEVGKVVLAAYHENGMVNIALIDDGAGIDPDRIKSKAIEKELITEKQADEMSEEEVLNLIFAPGFSIAKKVSDVSGRGVGMDVVRTNIEKLRGTVHISSVLGKGTRIILKLPLTLAIIPAMIVSAGRQRFAIPEIGLVEIVRVVETDLAKQIQMVCNAPVLRLRNNLLPLVDLAEVLELQGRTPYTNTPDGRQQKWEKSRNPMQTQQDGQVDSCATPMNRRNRVVYVMVININGNEFGMVVDDVLDSEEIVVKPLPSFSKDNVCFSATTILGDGSVALIIDYAGIMEKARINTSNIEKAAHSDLDEARRSAMREKQNIILLETGSGLLIGIVNSMVGRVEKIVPSQMETISGQPYVRYDDVTFRAIYPDQVLGLEGEGYMNESAMEGDEEEEQLCMVIPTIPGLQAGLIFSRIIDTMETYIDLDRQAIQAEGLFGTARINDRVVLFPDINVVFQMAGVMPPHSENHLDGDGLRALVVDDTPFLRILTSNYLSQVGFEVDQAKDGQNALQRLKEDQFDLVVSDLNMPIMDGFELAKEIPGTPNAEIPMIATTSSISSELENRCIRVGMVGCVPSMDKNRLLGMVSSLQRVQ